MKEKPSFYLETRTIKNVYFSDDASDDSLPAKISKISNEKEIEPWLQQILKQEVEHQKTNERFKVFALVAGSHRMQCLVC